ncbi:MAG: acyl carrier protein [Chromatiales bacterium]|jgi:acyl carrier protein
MTSFELAKDLLRVNLQLGERVEGFNADTPLMGGLPEFDSMAVINVIGAIEEQLGCSIEDEEITAEVFETVGSLAAFIDAKRA